MKMIGLCGAHRTGKTTLCQKVINHIGDDLTEVPISISDMQKELGFDSANQDYDWDTRKSIQRDLLFSFSNRLKGWTGIFTTQGNINRFRISERTPLDLIGYLIANAPENPTEEDMTFIYNYVTNCIELTNQHYTHLYLLKPGIAYVHSPTSANQELIEKVDGIITSAFLDPRIKAKRHIIDFTDLDQRVEYVVETSAGN